MALYLIGSATVDRQVHANGTVQTARGGVVTYAGLTFARHGLAPHALFYETPHRLAATEAFFVRHGVVPHVAPAEATTTFVNHLSADGARRQELEALAPPIGAAHPGADWQAGDHVHLGPLHADDLARALFTTLHGVTVTLDVQGYVRAARPGPVAHSLGPLLQDALQAAHTLKADAREWALICAHFKLPAQALMQTFGIDEVVLTHGAEGGRVVQTSGVAVEYAAAPVPRLVDATGAGDVFFAAYLYHRQYRRATIDQACRSAAEVAALQVSDQYIRRAALDLEA